MNKEKEITESKISEMLSNLKTTEEDERGNENMNEEKEISESETSEMLSNLKTTEENERGKGNMNEEKEITESEINEMLSNMESWQEKNEFLRSPINLGWRRKRNERFLEDCAKIALTQYNGQNETNFSLDKISCASQCMCPTIAYFHLNFIAEFNNGSNDEKKRCMFFAEVAGYDEKVVSVCCILDPVAGMDSGCQSCSHKVYHPRGCSFFEYRPT